MDKMANIYIQDPGPLSSKIMGIEPVIFKRIIKIGLPVVIGMLTQTTINTVDLIMIGRLEASLAVPGSAAILSSIIVLWVFGGFLSSVSVGTQAISARRFSEGSPIKAGAVLTNSLAISLALSILLTFLAIFFIDSIMNFITPSRSVEKIAISFSRIRLIGLVSMALMASYKSFYDGIGAVKIHMTVAIVMNIINILCNYFLIFGFSFLGYKISPMNVNGAALGSVISSYSGLIMMFIWSLRKENCLKFKIYKISNLNINIIKSISKLSLWSGLATVVLMVGFAMFSYIAGQIDIIKNTPDISSAAASIVTHVVMLVFMSSLAFGTSTATLVSQSIGAGLPDLAKRYTWQSALLALYVMSAIGLILSMFPYFIANIFMPTNISELKSEVKNAVTQTAIPSLKLTAGLLSPIASAALVLTQALYGAGETKYVMLTEFILHFLFLIPLTWIFAVSLELGLIGCWMATVAYASALLIVTGARFWSEKWKKLTI